MQTVKQLKINADPETYRLIDAIAESSTRTKKGVVAVAVRDLATKEGVAVPPSGSAKMNRKRAA